MDSEDNVILLEPATVRLRAEFLGWQCRIRQMAMRQFGGRPLEGMRPAVFAPDGSPLAAAVTVLISPAEPYESTAFFRFQVSRTNDPAERYEKALQFLAAGHFQEPQSFTDELTALFGPGSELAQAVVGLGRCVLEFAQFGQGYRLPCNVERLPMEDDLYQATYWHNRLFNPDMPAGVQVLAFTPDWTHASSFRTED